MAVRSAPAANSRVTTAVLPDAAAQCSAVWPSYGIGDGEGSGRRQAFAHLLTNLNADDRNVRPSGQQYSHHLFTTLKYCLYQSRIIAILFFNRQPVMFKVISQFMLTASLPFQPNLYPHPSQQTLPQLYHHNSPSPPQRLLTQYPVRNMEGVISMPCS